MPHLSMEYSINVPHERVTRFCEGALAELTAIGLYPVGGIRVRALPCPAYALADTHPANAFVDMVFRIGKGRSESDKKATGARLMAFAEAFFAKELAQPHFALSLEIVEIDPVLSWKNNSIHPRLNGTP